MRYLLSTLTAVAWLTSVPQAFAADGDLYGVWRNPKNSVHVDIHACGASVCGKVVWASDKARADARKGSGQELVGQELFRQFEPVRDEWRGRVFVPDLNRTFSGSVRLRDAAQLEARGCALGRVLCKTQVWSRVR